MFFARNERRVRQRRVRQDGFTILEVLAALIILGLIAASILPLLTTTGMWIRGAGQATSATSEACALLEDLRAHRENIKTGVFRDEEIFAPGGLALTGLSLPDSQAEITILPFDRNQLSPLPGTNAAELYNVRVQVSSVENGRRETVVLCTVVSGR